jgi:hypothetical protein
MEILDIKSGHGLTTSIVAQRPASPHTYRVNCRQFESAHRDWQRTSAAEGRALGVMTLNYERIWITSEEVAQVADAIRSTRSPLTLE